MKQQWHDRVQDYLAGSLTPEQTAELEAALRDDPHLRELYLKYVALEVALENQAEAADMITQASPLLGKNGRGLNRRRRWRALVTAAACLLVGFMTSSVLWAYVIPRGSIFTRVGVSLENPSFENPGCYKPTTRPRVFGIWNGDPAAVVGEDSGVQPREGRLMLRLEPKDSGPLPYRRIEQLIDVSAVVPPEGCTVEASFAFRSESEKQASRYHIKVFAFNRSLETSGDVRGDLTNEGQERQVRIVYL